MRHYTFRRLTEQRGGSAAAAPKGGGSGPLGANNGGFGAPVSPTPNAAAVAAGGIELTPAAAAGVTNSSGGDRDAGQGGLANPFAAPGGVVGGGMGFSTVNFSKG